MKMILRRTFVKSTASRQLAAGKTFVVAVLALSACTVGSACAAEIAHLQGEMSGEVSRTSVILQSRLTAIAKARDGDVPGAPGWGRFEWADNPNFESSQHSDWLAAVAGNDFMLKVKVDGLQPATLYYYRLEFGETQQPQQRGPTRTFKTHPAAQTIASCRFVVVTGMNFHYFHYGAPGDDRPAYRGPDKHLGYPALASMLQRKPDFFVATGDNVYYDAPRESSARTAQQMRKKWHEQLVQPRYVDFFASTPTYWEKDDHDYRYDDCDNTTNQEPSTDLGIRIFREQVPIVDPQDQAAVTYRTYRVGKLLQFWLPENRDYRSANLSPDGPEKTIWGETQRKWLMETLLESEATFKIIVSPTPMVGPDYLRKKDNHCDIGGFRHEGEAFFEWARKNGFLDRGLYFVCGDRHWQYHSIHPSGFEEFSCGALVDANSILGINPGSPTGTDPQSRIQQPYTSRQPSGGFLQVDVRPAADNSMATLVFDFVDENGMRLHVVEKTRRIE